MALTGHRSVQTIMGYYQSGEVGRSRMQYVQNNHNLAVREADTDFRAYCAREGIAVVTFSPLGIGFGASNTSIVFTSGAAAETLTVSRTGRLKRY